MLELRTYDPEEPEDIRALLLYCDAHHLQKLQLFLRLCIDFLMRQII